MWTSADRNREKYQKALVQLIKDNAERLAWGSDVSRDVDGYPLNEAHLLLNKLFDQAHDGPSGDDE